MQRQTLHRSVNSAGRYVPTASRLSRVSPLAILRRQRTPCCRLSRLAKSFERQSVMPTSSVAARSLALAILGLGAASAAFAQGPNVTAFNPYSGVGLPGGPVPQYGSQAAYPIVDTVGPTAGGPAFNPWQAGGNVGATYPVSAGVVVRRHRSLPACRRPSTATIRAPTCRRRRPVQSKAGWWRFPSWATLRRDARATRRSPTYAPPRRLSPPAAAPTRHRTPGSPHRRTAAARPPQPQLRRRQRLRLSRRHLPPPRTSRGRCPATAARAGGPAAQGRGGRDHRLHRPVGRTQRGRQDRSRSPGQEPRRSQPAPDRAPRLCRRRRSGQPQDLARPRAGRSQLPDRQGREGAHRGRRLRRRQQGRRSDRVDILVPNS